MEILLEKVKTVISKADPEANKNFQELLRRNREEKESSENPYAWQINEITMDISCSDTDRPWLLDLARIVSDRYECQYYLKPVLKKAYITFIGLLYDPVKCAMIMLDAYRHIRDHSERFYDRNRREEGDCIGYGFVFGMILENGAVKSILNSTDAFIQGLDQDNRFVQAFMLGYSIGTIFIIRDDLFDF